MTIQQKESGLRKLNTALLTICTTGVIWGAKELNSLDSRVARIEVTSGYQTDNITKGQIQSEKQDLHLNSLDISIFGLNERVNDLEHLKK